MKKLIVLIFILNTIHGFSQDKFKYGEKGLLPEYLVNELKSKSKEELFKQTKKWVIETFKNPDEVLKATIENEMIRIEGYKENLVSINSLGMKTTYPGTYTIEIEFKEGKFKFEPISLQYISQGNRDIPLHDGSWAFKNNGKVRGVWKDYPSAIESIFQELNDDLLSFLKSNDNEKDDW
jgi:hypothetical protein